MRRTLRQMNMVPYDEWLMHNDEWISTAVHNGQNGSHVFDPLISDFLDEMGDVICDSPLFKRSLGMRGTNSSRSFSESFRMQSRNSWARH